MNTFAVDFINLTANGYEVQVLRDALSDYRKTWIDLIRDCKEGKRPNMSQEGAEMILNDIEELQKRVSRQS